MHDPALNHRLGRYAETRAGGELVRAYLPPPLPPNPAIDLVAVLSSLSAADRAVGRLDGISVTLPDTHLFIWMYVRKEAVLSSQIEGTQSTLIDLLRYETDAAAGQPIEDVREVSNYVNALTFGLERLRTLPLSLRLIRELHGLLLSGTRGHDKEPGEFRRSQNWIGGTRPGNAHFVPPPVSELTTMLGALETFFHDDAVHLPPLIKAGLIHVQFETIHPFLDGNGRIGRLLITLYLCIQGVMKEPLLYLSLYLKTHRLTYYKLLQDVRETGNWEAWLTFFLDGVAETADQAFFAATRIAELLRRDRNLIRQNHKRAGTALQIHDLFQGRPFATSPWLVSKTSLSAPTVNAALEDLRRLGILSEVTGRQRGRVFAYSGYLDILNEGTTPLPP